MSKLVLGPEGFSKICVLGTASSSMGLAPFGDKSWAIWACSPGAYPICAQNRSDAWFEPHRWMPTAPGKMGAPGTKPWFSPEFDMFLKSHKGPVFMSQVQPSIPTSVRIPFEMLREKYGPYFWTSTLSYMIAMAIEELAPRAMAGEDVTIGLFGVDMAATEEYAYQRPGCQHFVGLAQSIGINVVLPPESDLMRPMTMYGIGEHNPRHIRLLARKVDLEANKATLTQQHAMIQQQLIAVNAGIEQLDYVLGSWSDDIVPDLRQAVSFSGEYVKPVGALKDLPADSTGADVVQINDTAAAG